MRKSSGPFLAVLLLCVSGMASAKDVVSTTEGDARKEGVTTPAVDPRKEAVIHELLELTGAIKLANGMVGQIIDIQRQKHPEIDAGTWDRVVAKFDAKDMIGETIRIYDRHFTIEELQATVAFYRTPTGQRLIQELPAVMSEAIEAGRQWGQRKADELIEELGQTTTRPTTRG